MLSFWQKQSSEGITKESISLITSARRQSTNFHHESPWLSGVAVVIDRQTERTDRTDRKGMDLLKLQD